jgi:very-short-patch-repair endonuclease
MSLTCRQHRHNVPAARDLRQRETATEDLLWEALRDRRLDGLKFRRQHPVGSFVIDFCCLTLRLAIELDGGVHETRRHEDAEREGVLTAAGYRVLRFPNEAVCDRLSEVLAAIAAAAKDDRFPRPFVPGRRAGL